MGDLISRKALLEDVKKYVSGTPLQEMFATMIDNQPTAYDVNKVVEQLEVLRQRRKDNAERYLESGNEIMKYGANCEVCALNRAIYTVKGAVNDVITIPNEPNS